jgi:hypothetical protein
MTDRNRELAEMMQAAMGLGASASASALRNVSQLAHEDGIQPALDQIAILSSLSERAQTCMSVAAAAEAEGDARLAEHGWLHALALMNHMTEQATEVETPMTEQEHFFSRQVAGRRH